GWLHTLILPSHDAGPHFLPRAGTATEHGKPSKPGAKAYPRPFRFISQSLIFGARRGPSGPSVSGAAAGAVENAARGERAFVARQPCDQSSDLVDFAESPHRDLRQHEG